MKRDNWVSFLPYYLLVLILGIGIAYAGERSVNSLSDATAIEQEHCFIIDAGHGGIDGGATSCTGVLESQINLEIAMRINDLFRFMGYETVMIRTTDTSIYTSGNTIAAQKLSDLKERVRIVNNQEKNILISLHQNTFSDKKYSGAQVFYSPAEGSKILADTVQSALVTVLNPGSRRTAKKGEGIFLLQHIERPGILIECGFLSNPQEEALLRSSAYQKKLCSVIAAAITRGIYT